MSDLFIFDTSDNLITILSNTAPDACKFWGAPFKEVLNQGSTFEFNVSLSHPDSQYIVAENQVVFKDKDGNFRLFVITEPEELADESGQYIKAVCIPGMNELNDEFIEDVRPFNTTLADALTRALTGCRWQPGNTADFGIKPGTNFYYEDVISALNKIINNWGGEILDRVTISGGKITGRYIDILPRRGTDTGKIWEVSKDIIKYSLKTFSYPKTALYGIGASLQTDAGGFTRKINFADIEWSTANGNPTNKPLGQEWVGDDTALQTWGRIDPNNPTGPLKHRKGKFEDGNIKDAAELLQATWNELQKQTKQVLNLTMDVFLLGELSGYEHEKVRLGDTTYAVNKTNKKPIIYEERVISFEYDLANEDSTGVVELGNYIDLYEAEKKLAAVEAKLNDKSGIWDNAGTNLTDTNISDTAPGTPTNFIAKGLFKLISLRWDFDPGIYIAAYELYASKTNNFTPDASNLVWRGKAGGVNFEAATDEQWYFRLRASNTHGTVSAFTAQVMAQTVRVGSLDYAALSIGDAVIENVSADKITFGTLDGTKANIVHINADNIDAGKVKAQYVEIGSSTTFQTGYDPTKRYFIGNAAPADTSLIWIDTTDSNNVLWKIYDTGLGIWRTGPSGPRGPQGLQGLQGPTGDQGIQGPAGANGVSSYTHIAYATNSTGTTGFSTSDSTNKTYIGIYVDSLPTDSTNPADYNWTLIKGADGAQGIQGPAGANGQTPYLHIAYAQSADGVTGFNVSDATNATYIGTYTDYTAADSTSPTAYTWAKMQGPTGPQGVQGPAGANGQSLYTWVKYADNASGGGMSDSPTNKAYIGLAYNKTTATESSTASDYTWSLIQGSQGVQGPPGADGITTYTWVKYADDSAGNGMSDSPTGKRYLGLAYNKTTATESTNAVDYSWSPLYDNVQVGARNLLLNSSFSQNVQKWGTTGIDPTFVTVDNFECAEYTGAFGRTLYAQQGVLDKLEVNETYTFSGWVKAENIVKGPTNYTVMLYTDGMYDLNGTSTWFYYGAIEIDVSIAGWQHVKFQFTTDSKLNTATIFNVYLYSRDYTGNIYFRNLKLEKGNIPTDWTPSPEDVQAGIDAVNNNLTDQINQVTVDYNTAIKNNSDSVLIEVDKRISTSEGNTKSYTDTKVQANADSFNVSITSINNTLNGQKNSIDTINTYFKFDVSGLTIGKAGNPLQITISNAEMDFIDNGQIVAYVNGKKMYIKSLEVLNDIVVGNHKIEKYDNNITIVRSVGG